jgi:hypothetical protein
MSEKTIDNIEKLQQAINNLVARGLVVKTGRTRNGEPVYVLTKYATPEEIRNQQRQKN